MAKKKEEKKKKSKKVEKKPKAAVSNAVRDSKVWNIKGMTAKAKVFDIIAGGRIAVLNATEAFENDIYPAYRGVLKRGGKKTVAMFDLSEDLIKRGEIGLFSEVRDALKAKEGDEIIIEHLERPASIDYVKKKLDGKVLEENEIDVIITDLMDNRLSQIELAAFISAMYIRGMSDAETVALTKSIVKSGDMLDIGKKPIVDKHCLTGEVPVMIKNSGTAKVEGIGKIIDSIFERCKEEDIEHLDGAEFTRKHLRNMQVPTYDSSGQVGFKKVTGVFRAKAPKKVHKIVLKGNRSVTVTPDHTIFTLKKGRIVNVPARSISKGDYVIVPTSIQVKEKKKDLDISNIPLEKERCKHLKNKIEITPEFVRLIAYYIAEGFTNYQGVFLNFDSHEKELIEDSKYCVKKVFGFEPIINKPYKTVTRVSIYSQRLAKVFEKKIKAGSNALEKRIPSFIFDLGREQQIEFLKAIFKCDGYVRRGYEAIYTTASKQLAVELQYMLSFLGMSVSISKSKACEHRFPQGMYKTAGAYFIYTQAREIFGSRQKANVAFTNLIPIKHTGEIDKKSIGWKMRKALKNQKYITKEKLRKIKNYIKSDDMKKIIDGHLGVLEVKSNTSIKPITDFTYDFEVEGYNKFMAGSAPICIHNCLGGVAGNRTTMVLVPIIAAAGLYIPKSSSRSITSASGTADTMEVLAPVDIPINELKKIVLKTKGSIVWGGGMNLAAADDKLIKIRHPLSLDPKGVMLASVLAKKKAVNATHVVIDIPIGRGAKVQDMNEAKDLADDFIHIGKELGMGIEAIITDGSDPIGIGIGPALECKDVLEVLDGAGPYDLREKSCELAGKLLELCGKVGKGRGRAVAEELIQNGKAMKKFREIIEAQGGDPKVKVEDLPIGEHKYTVIAPKNGRINHIDNRMLSKIARAAGSPRDKGAGVALHAEGGDKVRKGDVLFEIYAENPAKLNFAIKALKTWDPIELEKYLLKSIR